MNRRIKLILLISVLAFTFYCLFIQPELLAVSISEKLNFPWGSLVIWFGILAYTLLFQLIIKMPTKYILLKVDKLLRSLELGLALLWLPVSYFISGNLAFAFLNKPIAFKLWIAYTLVILLLPFLLLLLKLFGKSEK
ncbi:hypothetical protein [uncultured Draconibacterium sp.]|uniref:hypothetical protein n=1 Tax=uncultured Draconibacterium sp. TaxID=1573823 RepID=UPI0025E01B34|nr:hypothetical protein [uncultured Draconibacterium sp.]